MRIGELSQADQAAVSAFYGTYLHLPSTAQAAIYRQSTTAGGGEEAWKSDRLKHAAIGALAGAVVCALVMR